MRRWIYFGVRRFYAAFLYFSGKNQSGVKAPHSKAPVPVNARDCILVPEIQIPSANLHFSVLEMPSKPRYAGGTMTRRLRILLAALIVGLVGFYPLLAPTPHRIDKAHCDRIAIGMTKDEVEAIFGVPAGQYDWAEEDGHARFLFYLQLVDAEAVLRTRLEAKYRETSVEADGDDTVALGAFREVRVPSQTSLTWTSRHGSFMVRFDDNERVVSTNASTEVRLVPPWKRWWTRYWKK
jgi:hypothetical protein